MPFDVEAIDVSESEGEQDAVASIDGDDESESSGSEEGDDDGFSISDKDDSDSDDQEDSGVESPLSTYDPIPAASLLSSSAPSPSMMTGRLGLFGGVQQTHNGDILRRSQEIERHGSFSQKDLSSPSHDQGKGIDLVLDVQAATTTAFVANEQGIPWTVSEQDDHDSEVDDTASLGSAPSPALSHFTPAYSAQSTAPSSPSLPVSPYSLDSKHIPDSRLPQGLSPSTDCNSNIPDTMDGADETSEHLFSETAPMSVPLTPLVSRIPTLVLSIDQHATPISPPQKQNDEQEDNVESYLSTSGAEVAHRSTEDLVDEGVFEEEDVRCHHSRSDSCKTQDLDVLHFRCGGSGVEGGAGDAAGSSQKNGPTGADTLRVTTSIIWISKRQSATFCCKTAWRGLIDH
ncbi:hypothetical protein BGZ97_002214 [Linnemannia gamsii]|uniref:Uncharacterized protein n=1 Tax=Linnemannia gamsii TaxID=64522 RepID=A0A9P6QZ59_9FUNG|nr:hypothetical protein BGZ97_002214 [Linnemannia gamsii]